MIQKDQQIMVKKVKNERVRVAIGCQGGGIITAFTAGVLKNR